MRRYRIANLAMDLDEGEGRLAAHIAALLKLPQAAVSDCRVVRRALDARRKFAIHHVCTVECLAERPAPEPADAAGRDHDASGRQKHRTARTSGDTVQHGAVFDAQLPHDHALAQS